MSAVAFPARSPAPGWWRTAWALLTGWLAAAVGLLALYAFASLAGVIGVNSGPSQRGIVNEWPFPENGWWSLSANIAVILLALLFVTVATAWRLRQSFEQVSEPRLAVVLLITGGVPFVVSSRPALIVGFVVAVWLVRRWVVRASDHAPRRVLFVAVGCFASVVASYGLFHPVWVESASAITLPTARGRPSLLVTLKNVSRARLTVERVTAGPLFTSASPGFSQARHVAGLRIAPGATQTFILKMRPTGCASALPDAGIRYRLFGLTLNAPLRIQPSGLPRCK